jgi:hypothetical protein
MMPRCRRAAKLTAAATLLPPSTPLRCRCRATAAALLPPLTLCHRCHHADAAVAVLPPCHHRAATPFAAMLPPPPSCHCHHCRQAAAAATAVKLPLPPPPPQCFSAVAALLPPLPCCCCHCCAAPISAAMLPPLPSCHPSWSPPAPSWLQLPCCSWDNYFVHVFFDIARCDILLATFPCVDLDSYCFLL